jgi:hypothetical protein
MNLRVWALLLFAVLPGAAFAGMSAYWLFPDWVQLQESHSRYTELANRPVVSATDLMIAEAAENRHRINCLLRALVFCWAVPWLRSAFTDFACCPIANRFFWVV